MVDGFDVFLGDNDILLYASLPQLHKQRQGVYFYTMLYFIQSHRKIITLSHGLQRIFTSNHVGRYHTSRRKRNHVTSMARPILQTKGLLLFVAKITSMQTFRLGSMEIKFGTNVTQHNK